MSPLQTPAARTATTTSSAPGSGVSHSPIPISCGPYIIAARIVLSFKDLSFRAVSSGAVSGAKRSRTAESRDCCDVVHRRNLSFAHRAPSHLTRNNNVESSLLALHRKNLSGSQHHRIRHTLAARPRFLQTFIELAHIFVIRVVIMTRQHRLQS